MQFDDKYLTHPTKSPKLHLSLALHTGLSIETENTAFWQILSWIQHFSLPTSPSQHQTPSTLAACLSNWFRTLLFDHEFACLIWGRMEVLNEGLKFVEGRLGRREYVESHNKFSSNWNYLKILLFPIHC